MVVWKKSLTVPKKRKKRNLWTFLSSLQIIKITKKGPSGDIKKNLKKVSKGPKTKKPEVYSYDKNYGSQRWYLLEASGIAC